MAKLGGTALPQFCMAMTGTDHERYTEVQLEELMSLRAKYFLHAWEQTGQEVYHLLVPEVVDATARLDIVIAVKGANSDSWTAFWESLVLRSACSSMTA